MNYDNVILLFINGFSGNWAWLDKLVCFISQYGPLLFGLYLIGLWFHGNSKSEVEQNRKRALFAFFSALLALGMNQVISHVWFRERPYINNPVNRLLPVFTNASFPSDHTAGAFSIAGSLFGHTPGSRAMMVLAALIAFSRVYAGVHYPSDILGGVLTGLVSSYLIEKNKDRLDKPVTWLLNIWDIIEAKLPFPLFTKSNNQ